MSNVSAKVHGSDESGWFIVRPGLASRRRYQTIDDARHVAAALKAGFIDGETDEEVSAVLSITAQIDALTRRESDI